VDEKGNSYPNYRYDDLLRLSSIYAERGLQNPAVIVDTNHANSGKQYEAQITIAKDVLQSCRQNADVKRLVKGLMIESYLADGCQPVGGGVYGQSITDPCLGWEKTERLIFDLAEVYE
jgi:3-deoxy-7-phosphoheptulonate synthase